MKKQLWIVTIALLMMIPTAFADGLERAEKAVNILGIRAGNGGDAVVCFSLPGTKQKVLNILKANKEDPDNAIDPFSDEVLSAIDSVKLLDLYVAEKIGIMNPTDNYLMEWDGTYQEQLRDQL